jgi:hypothetical protein
MPEHRVITALERALARAEFDGAFRAEILEQGREAQFEYRLCDDEWHLLFAATQRIERVLALDPDEATEVDHGEAEAAGVKG